MKILSVLILILLLCLSTNTVASPRGATFKTPIQFKSCLPTNALAAGTQNSIDFGRSFNPCAGFTCQSGYAPSGDVCVASNPANTYCGGGLCWDLSNGSVVSYFACANITQNQRFYCNPSYMNTWAAFDGGVYKADCNTNIRATLDGSSSGSFTSNCSARP